MREMRFSSCDLMRYSTRFLPFLSFGLMASSAAASGFVSYTQSEYIGGHPGSTCNYIAKRDYSAPLGRPVAFVFVRGCGRGMPWEQELSGVSVLAGGGVLHVPRQVLVDGRSFPGEYWCRYSSVVQKTLSMYRSASCVKTGWSFGTKWSP